MVMAWARFQAQIRYGRGAFIGKSHDICAEYGGRQALNKRQIASCVHAEPPLCWPGIGRVWLTPARTIPGQIIQQNAPESVPSMHVCVTEKYTMDR